MGRLDSEIISPTVLSGSCERQVGLPRIQTIRAISLRFAIALDRHFGVGFLVWLGGLASDRRSALAFEYFIRSSAS